MWITIFVLVVSVFLFMNGKIRSDIVALCALLCLLLTNVLTPQEALAGFSSPVVLMMAGLFIVGGAVLQTGLAKKASAQVIKLGGKNETTLFLLIMLVTTLVGAFVSNTGTVALMLPIVVSIAAQSKLNAARFLMPLAFASSIGGMLTLIGTPPNLVIQDTLTQAGYQPLEFFSFTPIGLVTLAVGVLVLIPMSKLLVKKNAKQHKHNKRGKTLGELAQEYNLHANLHNFVVNANSAMVGQSIGKLNIYNRYHVMVMEVRRETASKGKLIHNIEQVMANPETIIQAGDILYLSGEDDNIEALQKDFGLVRKKEQKKLNFYDLGIVEVVLLNSSRFVGKMMRDTMFRTKYQINVVGIRRNNEYIVQNLANMKLHSGDVLLLQGSWHSIGQLRSEEDQWVVLGEPLEQAANVSLDYKAPLAGLILLVMIVLMVFDFIPVAPVTAVLLASTAMILTKCFRSVEAAYKTINWESLILIAAMMPMSTALEKTGASALLSHSLVDAFGSSGPMVLLAGIYFTTSLLTLFISNTACAVLMAPIALGVAGETGISPYPMLFAVTVAASMCFASPFSTPPNALVFKAGGYTFADYIKVGLPLQITIGIVMTLILPLIYPF